MLQTVSIIVTGKVQGVFFRQSARQIADGLGVTGTIKNCADGSVKIMATGAKAQLDELIAWCYRGPARAIVTAVITESIPLVEFKGFEITR